MDLKVGFIGTGGIANLHMNKLKQVGGVEIAALCDVSEQKAKAAAQKHGGRVYLDHQQMLDQEKLDALYICLPPFAHSGQELDGIKLGLPMFVEKPVSLELSYAERVAAAIREAGIITAVGYLYRYSDLLDKAKERLGDRKLNLFVSRYICPLPRSEWWGVRQRSGGQLLEQVTHHLDIARYMIGEVTQVSGWGANNVIPKSESFDIEDTSALLLKFANGALGTVSSTCVLKTRWNSEFDLVAEGLRIEVKLAPQPLLIASNGSVEEVKGVVDPFLEEDKAFIDAVRAGDPSRIRCDYEEAVKTLKISLAAADSIAAGGKAVHI